MSVKYGALPVFPEAFQRIAQNISRDRVTILFIWCISGRKTSERQWNGCIAFFRGTETSLKGKVLIYQHIT